MCLFKVLGVKESNDYWYAFFVKFQKFGLLTTISALSINSWNAGKREEKVTCAMIHFYKVHRCETCN
jgi:hypothetical protein